MTTDQIRELQWRAEAGVKDLALAQPGAQYALLLNAAELAWLADRLRALALWRSLLLPPGE